MVFIYFCFLFQKLGNGVWGQVPEVPILVPFWRTVLKSHQKAPFWHRPLVKHSALNDAWKVIFGGLEALAALCSSRPEADCKGYWHLSASFRCSEDHLLWEA